MYCKNFFYLLLFLILSTVVSKGETKVNFKKGTIKIGKLTLNAEFAVSNSEQQLGLMNRTDLPENFGMLLIFKDEDYRSFWMKNTFVDLSIAYIGSNNKILEILEMKAVKSSLDVDVPSYPSSVKAKYALEVKKGWFQKNKIKVGDSIRSFSYN